MRKFLRPAICGLALLSATQIFGVTLNFDDLGTGTNVTNQYSGDGIVFTTTPGFTALNNTFGGVVFTPSGSNYLAVNGNGSFDFMIGATPGTVASSRLALSVYSTVSGSTTALRLARTIQTEI